LVAIVAVVFAGYGVELARNHRESIREGYQQRTPVLTHTDFSMFYAGAELLLSSDRADTYDRDTQVRKIFEVRGNLKDVTPDQFAADPWMRFYNPPAFLLTLAPLTLIDIRTAYLVAVAANIFLAGYLALVAGRVAGGTPAVAVLVALATITAKPVYDSIEQGQPSILIALLALLAFEAIERGRHGLSSLFMVTMGMKPQFLVLTSLALLKAHSRMLPYMAGFGFLILLVPFGLIGPGGFLDFLAHAGGRGSSDLSSASQSWGLMNLGGFLRMLTGDAPGTARWLLVCLPTLGLWATAAWRGDLRTALAAGLVATVLVVPHVHVQDWVVFVSAAALLLGRDSPNWTKAVASALFLAIYVSVNSFEAGPLEAAADEARAVLWAIPLAFCLLVLMAATPWLESRPRASGASSAAPPEPASAG
jgi:hypothetical protein